MGQAVTLDSSPKNQKVENKMLIKIFGRTYAFGKDQKTPAPKQARQSSAQRAARAEPSSYLGGVSVPRPRRASVESLDTWGDFTAFDIFTKRLQTSRYSLDPAFDFDIFRRMDFDTLAEIIADISPEVSKALWDFVLMCNSGYECKAYRSNTTEIDEAAQKYLDDEILDKLGLYNGTVGVFFDRIFLMVFLRGSFLMELILDENGYDFVDIATPDTKTLSFRRIFDEKRGQIWDFGQRQQQAFVSLNLPQIRYIPIHPLPDSIEGRALCTSAFFVAIFMMSVLRDTKRVIQHQGYLRLDVEIAFDKLRETMPTDIQDDPDKVKKWMDAIISQVEQVYRSLAPDDTYIHGDTVTINDPVGTVSGDSLRAIDALFQALERMAVRALKTMPLLLGTNQSQSETQANREWEIYAKGIESVQHPVELAFEYLTNMAMQAQGFAVDVKMRFTQFRAAELMRDAQVDQLRAQTARFNYDCGYISQDEAAQAAVGKEVADMPEPRNVPAPIPVTSANENPNPGEGRDAKIVKRLSRFLGIDMRQATLAEIEDAKNFLDKFAPDALQDMYDADLIEPEPEQPTTEVIS